MPIQLYQNSYCILCRIHPLLLQPSQMYPCMFLYCIYALTHTHPRHTHTHTRNCYRQAALRRTPVDEGGRERETDAAAKALLRPHSLIGDGPKTSSKGKLDTIIDMQEQSKGARGEYLKAARLAAERWTEQRQQ